MKAELLSTLQDIRKQIDTSSYERLPLQLTRGFLRLCDLMNKHREELEGQLSKSVLGNVLETVSTLLMVDDQRQNGCENEYEYTCESCDQEIIVYNNDLLFSIDMHKQTDSHLEMTKKLNESLSCLFDTVSIDSSVKQESHSSSRPATVTFKNCNSVNKSSQSKKQVVRDERIIDIWRNLSDDFFTDEILITSLKLDIKSVWFCSGCNKILESEDKKTAHTLKEKHKANVESLRQADISSAYYGLMLGKWRMQYCVLCSAGLCSPFEIDWHVKSSWSGHCERLRQLRAKVFSDCAENLLSNFPNDNGNRHNYSLDAPLVQGNREKCLTQLIVISKAGTEIKYCCLCDTELPKPNERHFASEEHGKMIFKLTESFRAPGANFGIILKNQYEYCVLCHVGFLNHFELQNHVSHSTRHLSSLNHYRSLIL